MTRNALGRGLSALIREPEQPSVVAPTVPPTVVDGWPLASTQPTAPSADAAPPTGTSAAPAAGGEAVQQIDVYLMEPSPYQPRRTFREEPIRELANSIRQSGVIQPLIVRRVGTKFQLIAGERRWRAAQQAGLMKVPAVVRQVTEEKALELALIENLQREDLDPIEQARAFDRLLQEFHLTQDEVADRTGKDRVTVANSLRLLNLEESIQLAITSKKISASHARALLGVEDLALRRELARKAAQDRMTVRQLERFVTRKRRNNPAPLPPQLDANRLHAVTVLQQTLGTRVYLRPQTSKKPGLLSIEFYDERTLHSLYSKLMAEKDDEE